MQPIQSQMIQQLVEGVLLHGAKDVVILQAIDYKRHPFTRSHTLLFVRRSEVIDWQELKAKAPVVVLTDKPEQELLDVPGVTVIKVRSVLQAYWKFIDYYRQLFTIPVVAITGTCGKTTVKEMLKYVLEKDRTVQASVSSKNEPRQSMPYLLGITNETDAAIFELGLGNTGNIKHQCMIYQPTIGVITNIGVHHLDGCGDEAGYIKAKAEIVDGVQGGTLIVNADDARIKKIPLTAFKGRILTFGLNASADINASAIHYTTRGMKFRVHVEGKTYSAFMHGFGNHQVYNALAVFAVIHAMGASVQKAILRLRSFQPLAHHLQFMRGMNGSTIIDDTWTNNPTSIEAALDVLREVGRGKKVIVVLGDINRLGRFERKYHQEIGKLIAKQPVHLLVTVGKKAQEIARQVRLDGTSTQVHSLDSLDGVLELVKPELDEDTIVLIKGPMASRGMKEFAEKLQAQKRRIQ